MGRRRTQIKLSAKDRTTIQRQLNESLDPRAKERLNFILKASTGEFTLEELATRCGRARATLQNWLTKFEAEGIKTLLARDTPPGKVSPLSGGDLQKDLKIGLKAGRWSTAQQVADWLRQEHGIKLARKSVYYWFRKISEQPD